MNKACAVLIILLLGGSIFLLTRLGPKSFEVGDEEFKGNFNILGGWVTSSGSFFSFVTQEGKEVRGFDFTLEYSFDGRELNWETLVVHSNATVEITVGEKSAYDVLYDEVKHDKSGEFVIEKETGYFVGIIGADNLPNNSIVFIKIDVWIMGECTDIYAKVHRVVFPAHSTQSFVWIVPELVVNIDIPTTDPANDYADGWYDGYRDGFKSGCFDALAEEPPEYTAQDYPGYGGETYEEGKEEGYIAGYIDGYKAQSHTTAPIDVHDPTHAPLVPYAIIGKTDGGDSVLFACLFLIISVTFMYFIVETYFIGGERRGKKKKRW